MKTQTQTQTQTLVECAVMLALSTALSFIVLWQMPAGGSVTLCSMLPILLVGIKHGPKWGFSTAACYALLQLLQAIIKGSTFPYIETFGVMVLCALLDYILPYTLLGITGFFGKNLSGCYAGMTAAVVLRYFCHFFSGVIIWGQFTAAGVEFSLGYNAYLFLDFALCIVVAVPLLAVPRVRKLLGISMS